AEQKETAVRLELKALAAGASAKGAKPSPDAAATARLLAVLGDPRLVRENFDTLTEYADKIAGFATAPKSPERGRLVAAWTAALDWYAQSYASARGPATRLQWGVRYVNALVELAPQDAARIEHAAGSVIGELDPVPDTFYDRNLRALERMGRKLGDWSKDPVQRAALGRIRGQMDGVCAKL